MGGEDRALPPGGAEAGARAASSPTSSRSRCGRCARPSSRRRCRRARCSSSRSSRSSRSRTGRSTCPRFACTPSSRWRLGGLVHTLTTRLLRRLHLGTLVTEVNAEQTYPVDFSARELIHMLGIDTPSRGHELVLEHLDHLEAIFAFEFADLVAAAAAACGKAAAEGLRPEEAAWAARARGVRHLSGAWRKRTTARPPPTRCVIAAGNTGSGKRLTWRLSVRSHRLAQIDFDTSAFGTKPEPLKRARCSDMSTSPAALTSSGHLVHRSRYAWSVYCFCFPASSPC